MSRTPHLLIMLAALVCALAVVLGAFGAHALKARLEPGALATWQTAVQYHAWHGLALLAAGLLAVQWPDTRLVTLAAGLFVVGLVLFSGSLYALALTGQRALGALAPLGGAAFIAGWFALALAA